MRLKQDNNLSVSKKDKKKLITRYPNKNTFKRLYFMKGRGVIAIDIEKIYEKYDSHNIIKLFKEDFNLIKGNMKRLTHFNIQHCGHKPGERHLILKIEVPGYFDGKNEKPPILNIDNFLIAKCLSVRNGVDYGELTENDFKNSLENIKDVDSLKRSIVRRYKNSLAHLGDERKLSLGVAVTELDIIERFSKNIVEEKVEV